MAVDRPAGQLRNPARAALLAALAGIVAPQPADAQAGKRLFFEGDLVRGAQPGAPGPFCVLSNQFKRLERVVWRIRVLDAAGQSLDDQGLRSVMVELPDGQRLAAQFGPHPPPAQGPATDHFWTAAWNIPASYPSGTFAYKVVATDLDGSSHSWEPFKRAPSQLTVVAGEIQINKPQ
ncbi:MAG TPA: hypothetical protein VGF60_04370 [Xanthobacteraceae bacterium]